MRQVSPHRVNESSSWLFLVRTQEMMLQADLHIAHFLTQWSYQDGEEEEKEEDESVILLMLHHTMSDSEANLTWVAQHDYHRQNYEVKARTIHLNSTSRSFWPRYALLIKIETTFK